MTEMRNDRRYRLSPMTSSAKYADILLPDCCFYCEQMDFALDASCGNMSYVIFTDGARLSARFRWRTVCKMTSSGARQRLGVEQQFTGTDAEGADASSVRTVA